MVDYNINSRQFENLDDPTQFRFTGGAKSVTLPGDVNISGDVVAATVTTINDVADPGDGETITPPTDGSDFTCDITTAGAETRVMGTPTRIGQKAYITLETDGGDLVMSNAGGWQDGAENTATFDTAGEAMALEATGTAAATDWRITSKKGVALTTV